MPGENVSFKVDFREDMTLSYKDKIGCLKFVFQLGSNFGPKTIELSYGAVDENLEDVTVSAENSAWIDAAFDRVCASIRSCGYEVDIIGRPK